VTTVATQRCLLQDMATRRCGAHRVQPPQGPR